MLGSSTEQLELLLTGRTVINFGAWLKYRAVRTVTDWKNCYKLWCLAQVQSS